MKELQVKDSAGNPAGSVIFPWEEMEASLLEKVKDTLSSARLQEETAHFEEERAELQEQIAHLESKEHEGQVFLEWAHLMTPEEYVLLGTEIGYAFPSGEAPEEPVELMAVTAETQLPEVVTEDPHNPNYILLPPLGVWLLKANKVA